MLHKEQPDGGLRSKDEQCTPVAARIFLRAKSSGEFRVVD
jgi:hypothetical protein